MLQEVERGTFRRKQGLCVAADTREHFARIDLLAIIGGRLNLHAHIEPGKHRVSDFNARENEVLFGQKAASAARQRANGRARRDVATSEVFHQSAFDGFVNVIRV